MKKLILSIAALASVAALTAQTDILDMRTNFMVGDAVTVTGIVTSDDGLGSVRYIQDGTAGIAIYPGGDWGSFPTPVPGDEITVSGLITEFNGLLEVGPDLTAVTVNSSGNPLPEPQVILPSELGEDDEGELVRVNMAQFVTGGIEIAGNNTYDFSASGENGVIYVRSSNPLIGEILPAGQVDIVGIASQFTFDGTGGYQILARNLGDFVQESSINLASQVEQDNITTTSFDLSWTTDAAGSSIVNYGLTPDMGTIISDDTAVQNHEVSLTDLEPGTIYYIQVTSALGEDATSAAVVPFATVSESSGDILVYFNQTVDNTVATEEEAISLGSNMNDSIAAYIDRAMISVDVAVYNCSDNLIVAALNNALDRDVQVRYITEGSNLNIGLQALSSSIPLLERPDGQGSGMHNKFVVIDAEDVDNSFVLTGATNWTEPNLSSDYNDLIIFQDQSLARAYTLEFNEMWGSDGAQPDAENAKFGGDKSKNTPEKFIIGGSPVELYFSPSDNTTAAIIAALETAEFDMDFAVLSFTRNDIRDAVIAFNSIFATPRGVIENTGDTGGEYETLLENGVEVFTHVNIPLQVHHKMCIIDHSQPEADPQVVTGSHNWSSTAETVNDENTVVVHDARIANLYYQEWWALYSTFLSVDELGKEIRWAVYPNPTQDQLMVDMSNEASLKGQLVISDLQGRILDRQVIDGSNRYQFDVSALAIGSYVLSVQSKQVVESTVFLKK